VTPAVLVLGGTFDPVHVGHLAVLNQAMRSSGAGTGVLVPVCVPPLRPPAVASADDRLAMLRAAVGDSSSGGGSLQVSDVEVRRGGVSYTADTMDELRAAHAVQHALLLGADAARSIRRWHRFAALLDDDAFVVVNRNGEPEIGMAELRSLGFPESRTMFVPVDSPPVSASEVRRRVAEGMSIDALVAPAVRAYIERHGLYRNGAGRA
jgi:nicotinate-nucleotide adenylyltransferase